MTSNPKWPVGTILRRKHDSEAAKVMPTKEARPSLYNNHTTYIKRVGSYLGDCMWTNPAEWEALWIPEPELPSGINRNADGWYWHDDAPKIWIKWSYGTWKLASNDDPALVNIMALEAFVELMKQREHHGE